MSDLQTAKDAARSAWEAISPAQKQLLSRFIGEGWWPALRALLWSSIPLGLEPFTVSTYMTLARAMRMIDPGGVQFLRWWAFAKTLAKMNLNRALNLAASSGIADAIFTAMATVLAVAAVVGGLLMLSGDSRPLRSPVMGVGGQPYDPSKLSESEQEARRRNEEIVRREVMPNTGSQGAREGDRNAGLEKDDLSGTWTIDRVVTEKRGMWSGGDGPYTATFVRRPGGVVESDAEDLDCRVYRGVGVSRYLCDEDYPPPDTEHGHARVELSVNGDSFRGSRRLTTSLGWVYVEALTGRRVKAQ